ncbi:LysR family transcriptional regulator [Pararhizobium sp. IMCC21322]|uniref:LysR family transcriptional regulator n=1 Tax=Pararhizobium sp. IMCC21322 TaxID=3067903 RepID=UPI0027422E11|nr:LysR family transcriptional regulator [Pararhizobium sp. IMCC21322]
MSTPNWDDTRIFLAIARTGAVSIAARELGLGVATVSRRIARLEAALDLPLFSRHQTGYRLTHEGEMLLPKAVALEDTMRGLLVEAQDSTGAVGQVRVATAENLANPIIIPALCELLRRHPALSVDVITDVATVNLDRREADIAIRMVRPDRGNVTIKRVGTLGMGLYASAGYLEERPYVAKGDTRSNRYIGWSEKQAHISAAQWVAQTLKGDMAAISTTTLSAQLSAAVSGLGLAVLPHFLALEAGLVVVKAELGINQPIWFAMHSDLTGSHRVRIVADHLLAIMDENADRLSGKAFS